MLGAMEWLGLDWDEGPGKGGPHAPYRQSERGDLYRDVLARLAESKFTYDCYCTTEEVDARRKASGSKVQGYDGFCRELTAEQVAAFEAEGRRPVVRFRMPDGSDHLGRPGARRDHLRDPARPRLRALPGQRRPALHAGQPGRRRADGDHPRAARRGPALQHAPPDPAAPGAGGAGHLDGGAGVRAPAAGHGRGQQEASKRDPQAHLFMYRDDGFLPEGRAQLPGPARAGRSRPTATCSRSPRWSTRSTSGT